MFALIMGAVSAGSSTFNAVDEATSNRVIREKLDRVVSYLQALSEKLDAIQAQNTEILRRLDELPRIVRAIVQEVVSDALLDERYSAIRSIQLNITQLRLDRIYRITEPGWREFSKVLTYLFDHENRISYLFRLILACELAIAATRNQARPFILALLAQKLSLLRLLRDDYVARVSSEIDALKALLDNSQYIQEHNLTEGLGSFDSLSFKKQPNRDRTVTYFETECKTRMGHGPEYTEYEVCKDVQKTRTEPDNAFHGARDAHVSAIEGRISSIKAMLSSLKALSGVLAAFERYQKKVESLPTPVDTVLLFYPRTDAQAASRDTANQMSEEEASAFGYYTAGEPDLIAYSDASTPPVGIFEAVRTSTA